jgi:hypothetical protein
MKLTTSNADRYFPQISGISAVEVIDVASQVINTPAS